MKLTECPDLSNGQTGSMVSAYWNLSVQIMGATPNHRRRRMTSTEQNTDLGMQDMATWLDERGFNEAAT
jgi:hypothetical protein